MGWQPGAGDGAGASPDRGPGVPDGELPARDPRLSVFAGDGRQGAPPSGALALLADEVSGPGRRCFGATGNELAGLLRAWAAVESWAAAAKLGVIAELIRRDDAPPGTCRHGDLPDDWSASLRHELAAALSCSTQSAETTACMAWQLQARLTGVGARLDDGTITLAKARAVIETFQYLTDADAARAEALILGQLAGKTYPQVLRLAEQAALTVDPGLAARRREQAQQRDARVMLFREQQGTAGLSGRDLPPDEALAAMANVNARAQRYEDSGAFGDTRMDVLRAYAYLDLLNGVAAETRIACAEAQDETAEAAEALAWAEARAARATGGTGATGATAETGAHARTEARIGDTAQPPSETDTGAAVHVNTRVRPGDECVDSFSSGGCAGSGAHATSACGGRDARECCDDTAASGRRGHGGDGEPGRDDPDDDGAAGGTGPRRPDPGGPTPRPGVPAAGRALQARPPDFVVPLATLLGLAQRPGEIHGFGMLDPVLARDLAAAAARSPSTQVCITVTSPEGYAVGHGCARQDRASSAGQAAAPPGTVRGEFPARLNLTIPATILTALTRDGRDGTSWALTPRGNSGPPGEEVPPGRAGPDGCGSWTLTVPGGRRFTVRLDPIPVHDCDHRYESHGYQPSDRLRHLVQVRDGACTFPPCSRHARESDFEHAQPYDKGGRTCACNAGARSLACHRVKQSPGWTVTQPRPGWHQWQTPAGRVYVQEPWRYPA
jgi:hypothetical protein